MHAGDVKSLASIFFSCRGLEHFSLKTGKNFGNKLDMATSEQVDEDLPTFFLRKNPEKGEDNQC